VRVIAHISDLHFGRVDEKIVAALAAQIIAAKPDLIAVSGDLTQRARVSEFRAARVFLDSFPQPKVIVPGNHDIPLVHLFDRALRPLAKYREYISADLGPYYSDEEIAVLGINTARSLVHKAGRINRRQVKNACERFKSLAPDIVRIVVTHHPLDLPNSHPPSHLVGRAQMAMAGFAGCRVDLFLSGHLHLGHTLGTTPRYAIPGYSAVVVHAGTAASTRTRSEPNSWNLVRIQNRHIVVERFTWLSESGGFAGPAIERFESTAVGWRQIVRPEGP
jgi:3',5'-cyclic AMP phosphodiesterase CpdA